MSAGSFYLMPISAPSKPRAKSRSSANQYPIFLQLSYLICDPFWQNVFKQMAVNNLPNSFTIKKNQLTHRKGGVNTFSLHLVVTDVNDALGLNGLNSNLIPYVNACATQLYINCGSQCGAQMVSDSENKAAFYIVGYLINSCTVESNLLQKYILDVIEFLKQHAGLYSPSDYQRFHLHQNVKPKTEKLAWSDLDKNIKKNLYDDYVNYELSKLTLNSWQREYIRTQLSLYYSYGQVKDEHVVFVDGKITQICGIDLNKEIPNLSIILTKSRSSTIKTNEDPLIRRWRVWLGVFEY